MTKKYTFLFWLLILTIPLFAQLEVKPNSFKEVVGFVNIDPDKQTDDNDKPYAVLKIKTENISSKQRRELSFKGDAQTFFEVEYKDGEVWLYISYYATYIKISHEEFSSTEFHFPFDMEPKKGYELTLVNKISSNNVGFGTLTIVTEPQDGATIKLNGIEMTQKSPYVNDMIAAGEYDIEVSKYGFQTVTRHIVINDGNKTKLEINMPYACGKLKVSSNLFGASVFIDDVKVGVTPFVLNDIRIGRHTLRIEKLDYKSVIKQFIIVENQLTEIYENLEELHSISELLTSYVQNGYMFITLNGAINQYSNLSYGLTIGSVKRYGWFASLMTNFKFDNNYDFECDANHFINGNYPEYTGTESYTSLSLIGGMLMRLSGPVALRIGAGYGMKMQRYETNNGYWVKDSSTSANGLDISLGLQCNLRGLVLSIDLVSTNFSLYETKIGIGYGRKNK